MLLFKEATPSFIPPQGGSYGRESPGMMKINTPLSSARPMTSPLDRGEEEARDFTQRRKDNAELGMQNAEVKNLPPRHRVRKEEKK